MQLICSIAWSLLLPLGTVVGGQRSLGGASDIELTISGDSLSKTVGWFLYGGIAMAMVIFYLVNHKDKDIVDATWLTISNMVSLFCAILLFMSFRELVALATGGEELTRRRLGEASVHHRLLGGGSGGFDQCWGESSDDRRLEDDGSWIYDPISWPRRLAGAPTQSTLAIDFVCFFLVFVLLQWFLFHLRRMRMRSAIGQIAGHMMGFSALYAFGNLQQCEPFRGSLGSSALVAVMALVGLMFMAWVAGLARVKLSLLNDGRVDKSEAGWIHQCRHIENEFIAFAVSFLTAQFLQFTMEEDLAPLHSSPKGRERSDALVELLICFLLGLCVVGSGYLEHQVRERQMGPAADRFMLMLEQTLSFTTGWCLLLLVKITFWNESHDRGLLGEGNVMTAQAVMVFFSSMLCFGAVFALDFVADRSIHSIAEGLRALMESFMLLVGLAWECAFWTGAHAMVVDYEDRTTRMVLVAAISLGLVLIVIPAWVYYILPHTLPEVELANPDSPRFGDPQSPNRMTQMQQHIRQPHKTEEKVDEDKTNQDTPRSATGSEPSHQHWYEWIRQHNAAQRRSPDSKIETMKERKHRRALVAFHGDPADEAPSAAKAAWNNVANATKVATAMKQHNFSSVQPT